MRALWSKIARWRQARAQEKRQRRMEAALHALPPASRDALFREVEFLRAQGVSVREALPGEDTDAPPHIGSEPI